MKRERNMAGKFIFIMFLPLFMAALILPVVKASAAYAGSDNMIGLYDGEEKGESIPGVKVSKNGETLCYALDTWKKTSDGIWQYTGSNANGYVSETESSNSSLVYIKGRTEARFGIDIDRIKEYMPERGSVVIRKYVYGKCTYKRAEFTYQNTENNPVNFSESILKHIESGKSNLDFASTKYAYNSASYIYNIYDAAVISRDGDIKAAIPEECKISDEGYAYYGAEGEYIVKELPQIEHNPEEGYTFTFKGWYTHNLGGDEVNIGDAIEPGIKIYPRWDKSRNTYNVKCTDIIGSSPGGQVLGTKEWTAYYNDEVKGADIGDNGNAGAYYKGFCYTGCTTAQVKNDCEIYRYFRPVSYDVVFNGNNEVSGETANLYGCLYGEKYMLPENGYKRNGLVILDLNAKDAICATKNINIPYKFTGWADTASGRAIYSDCEEITNLCDTDSIKQLYAVWEGGNTEINVTPVREGYSFNGWSKEKDDQEGNTWFDVSDSNNCVLYAIWKPLKAKYSVAYYIEDNKGGYILDKKAEYEAYTGYEADCSNDLYIKEYYKEYILDKDKSIYKGTTRFDGSLLLECYLKKKTPADSGNEGSTDTENKPGSGNEGSTDTENKPGSGNEGSTDTENKPGSGNEGSTDTENKPGSGNEGSTDTENKPGSGNEGGTDTENKPGSGNEGGTDTENKPGSGNEGSTDTENKPGDGNEGSTDTENKPGDGNEGSTDTENKPGNTNQGNVSGGSITGGNNASGGNNNSNGSSGGGSSSSGNVGSGSGGSSSGGSAGSISGGSNGGGSAGSVSGGSSGGGSAGSVSGGSSSGGSAGSVSGGSSGGGSAGNSGSGGSNTSDGSNVINAGGSSASNKDIATGSAISGNNSTGSSITTENGNETNEGDNVKNNESGKKPIKNKDSSKNKKISYPKAGKKYTKAGIVYKILKSNSKTKTVKVLKAKKNISKVKIPAFIKIKGYKYKVISIAKNAFIKCSKLEKAIIGKNIKSIGKKAFYKDKGLGNIKIKSKKLKSIGKGAFKNIKPGCTVKIAGNSKYARKVFSMISTKG